MYRDHALRAQILRERCGPIAIVAQAVQKYVMCKYGRRSCYEITLLWLVDHLILEIVLVSPRD